MFCSIKVLTLIVLIGYSLEDWITPMTKAIAIHSPKATQRALWCMVDAPIAATPYVVANAARLVEGKS